jgi:hypothetical protein
MAFAHAMEFGALAAEDHRTAEVHPQKGVKRAR